MFPTFAPTPITNAPCNYGPAPPAEGGVIADGIYQLATSVGYGPACGCSLTYPPRRETIVICANRWAWATQEILPPDAGPVTTFTDYTWTVSQGGIGLLLTPNCSTDSRTPVGILQYTYAGGQLTIVAGSTISTYMKQ
jgi:hypothetical protein